MSFTLNSGIRIFDIIEILLKNPKSREEICRQLQEKGINANTTTITKYIRTLRAAGFEILSEHDKFEIYKSPYKINLTEEEIKGFNMMESVFKYLFKNKKCKKSALLEEKLFYLFKYPRINPIKIGKENDSYEISEKESEIIEKINDYLDDEFNTIKIQCKNTWLTICPKELQYKKNGVFLNYFDKENKVKRVIRTSKISKIKFVNKESDKISESFNETVFKITGRLKKNYILKKGERAKYTDDEIFVTNIYEDKNELFNRLIKYGAYCEIISPEKDRKNFINKVKGLIKHYNSM